MAPFLATQQAKVLLSKSTTTWDAYEPDGEVALRASSRPRWPELLHERAMRPNTA
jgi:hypothetical protein